MKTIAISIVLFAACLVVHAEVQTFYSDSTCTTAKTASDAPDTKTLTWTSANDQNPFCKTAVPDPSTDGTSDESGLTSYRKFVCNPDGISVAMKSYSDHTCGTPAGVVDAPEWSTILAGGCWSTWDGESYRFNAALSDSSWGEDCPEPTNSPTNSPTSSPTKAPTVAPTSPTVHQHQHQLRPSRLRIQQPMLLMQE